MQYVSVLTEIILQFAGVILATLLFVISAAFSIAVIWDIYKNTKNLKTPPEKPQPPESSINIIEREIEIRRIVRYILSGQSCALIGIFDEERRNILSYLRNTPELCADTNTHKAERLLFSPILDISAYPENAKEQDFWVDAFASLETISEGNIAASYQTYKTESSVQNLENIIDALRPNNYGFILLLDRF